MGFTCIFLGKIARLFDYRVWMGIFIPLLPVMAIQNGIYQPVKEY